ncbi:MAG: hypothetical protein H7Z74_13575 [Anaerolineae bacterium]|nr:hypothetical protein [Gemmatimonadaceae bacterium]
MKFLLFKRAAAGALALTIAACNPDRAVSTDAVGDPAYGIQLVLTGSNVPKGSVKFTFPRNAADPVRDTVRVTLTGLDTLESGFYTVFLGDSLGTSFKRATGTLIVTRTDTVLNALGDPVPQPTTTTFQNVSSFQNGGPRNSVVFVTTRAQSGLTASDSIQTVLVTIEDNAQATTPSASRRPIFARRGQGTAVPATGAASRTSQILFGNYGGANRSDDFVFIPTGRGRAYVRGSVLVINDSSLTRPPLGYYYAAFAVKGDSTRTPIDTVYLGEFTAPFPRRNLSLFNADSLIVDPLVQPAGQRAVLAASIRIDADTVSGLGSGSNPFLGFTEVFVTLESKNKVPDRLGPAIILRAALPDIIRLGRP